ncbi:hypothetical protein B0181_01020 [Moraxella caviae]|uniref:Uncharacterized protein n=1 Tax=Moraxella caviae TaxID=34060 RepID=A0A1T0AB52_9GAMM|nr:hypothetical protein [Moraxella caviae]OOR92952.1 hypothetical protein B0181_01020 [Moraxella caviae]STZ10080.1 Uncharacterised protein [Moraxella caviae]
MLSRHTVFFVASALPLLFVGLVAPSKAHELDFWLMWVLSMTLVGLPILFAEVALSARSAAMPWQGMQKLTREADASLVWRVFAGLSVVVAILIAASITARLAVGFDAQMPNVAQDLGVPTLGVSAALMVVALILSLLKARLLPVGLLLVVAGALVSLFDGGIMSGVAVPMMTEFTLGEFGRALLLALLSVGVGTGLYWFGGSVIAPVAMASKKSLAGLILPIWLTQLIFGAFALFAGSAMVTPASFLVSGVGMLLIAAFLLYYAASQLIARFGLVIGAIATLVLAVIFSPLPVSVLLVVLAVLSLLAVLNLAIFAGFVMKISHLRKTLNFGSEGRYNIWRVLVRIIVPLAVVVALAGLVMEWLA